NRGTVLKFSCRRPQHSSASRLSLSIVGVQRQGAVDGNFRTTNPTGAGLVGSGHRNTRLRHTSPGVGEPLIPSDRALEPLDPHERVPFVLPRQTFRRSKVQLIGTGISCGRLRTAGSLVLRSGPKSSRKAFGYLVLQREELGHARVVLGRKQHRAIG